MKVLASVILLSAGVLRALAGRAEPEPRPTTGVSFADLREKCAEYAANDRLKPIKVHVTCDRERSTWRPTADSPGGPATADSGTLIVATLLAKGFVVDHDRESTTGTVTFDRCRLESVKETIVGIPSELYCNDLVAVDDVTALCEPSADAYAASHPDAVTRQPTGAIHDECQ